MDTGSSASSTLGWAASALANDTRCRWPPDSSCGYFAANCSAGISLTCSSSAFTPARSSALDLRPWCSRIGRSRWCRTVCTGLSEANGSWKTIWTEPLYRRNARRLDRSTGSPSSRIVPEVIRSWPASILATVDLPEPLSPTRATTAPRYRLKETSLAARTTCPRPSRNSLFSELASIASSPRAAAAEITPPGSVELPVMPSSPRAGLAVYPRPACEPRLGRLARRRAARTGRR